MVENQGFDVNTVNAGKSTLDYNTKTSTSTEKNILDIIPDLKEEYDNEEWSKEAICIINGKITMRSKDKDTYTLAKSVGYDIFTYDVGDDGTLRSNDSNLALKSEDGTLVIPDGIKSIGEGAFALTDVKSIILPSTCIEIGDNAFNNCSTLEKIVLNEGLIKIGKKAFRNCKKLKEINFPNSITKIDDEAFTNCDLTGNVVVPNSVTELGNNVFQANYNLKNLVLSENITRIGWHMFTGTSITDIKFPKKISEVSVDAFDGSKIENIDTSENEHFDFKNGFLIKDGKSIQYIINNILKNTDTLDIPEGIENFSYSGTQNYTNLTKLIIPSSLKSITAQYLPESINDVKLKTTSNYISIDESNCLVLNKDETILYFCYNKNNEVKIKEGITSLGSFCFKLCGATSIKLPESLVNLGWNTFNRGMKYVYLGKNVKNLSWDKFRCPFLDSNGELIISNENSSYKVKDNVIYNSNYTDLIFMVKNRTGEFIVPNTVKKIEPIAFMGNSINSIKLNDGIEEIGNEAITRCNIKTIEIPRSIKRVGTNAFLDFNNVVIHKAKDTVSGSPWGCITGERGIVWDE